MKTIVLVQFLVDFYLKIRFQRGEVQLDPNDDRILWRIYASLGLSVLLIKRVN